jgi:hypothetical protein
MSAPAKVTSWVVDVPGAEHPFEVLAITVEQAVGLVAEALGRRVRLVPKRLGEPGGEVWLIRACHGVVVAPTVWPAEAAP